MAKTMNLTINFDMDGTIADLYGVENWLEYLEASDPTPYTIAKPMLKLNTFARKLNELQNKGCEINIISWLSKESNAEFDEAVKTAKLEWLKEHLPSVHFDNIYIVAYGTPKHTLANGILFDDEEPNRKAWTGKAYGVENIMGVLRTFC